MNDIKTIKKRYALKTHSYTIKKGVTIVCAAEGRFVFKRNRGNDIATLYKYLKSRNFNHFGPLVNIDPDFIIYEYIDDIKLPIEQRGLDMMFLLSLLHSKTTFYKEGDFDDYKKIFEEVNEQLEYFYHYYTELIDNIETKVYMSPTEYLLARNISKIFYLLSFAKKEIEEWYKLIKDKRKQRFVTLHNNVEVDHLLENNEMYLISWENHDMGMPIYDIYNMYKKHYFDFDFFELLKVYENKYPLLKEEKKLLFILISIPEEIKLTANEYDNCKKVNQYLDYIYITNELLSNYYTANEVK